MVCSGWVNEDGATGLCKSRSGLVRRKYTPQERERRAREDYHDPTAGIGGAPPTRSALTLRLILAAFGLLACTAGAVVFLVVVSQPVIAGIWAFFAATAIADMAVVARRKLRGEPG
jgi:Family of unknown function (DUF6343)